MTKKRFKLVTVIATPFAIFSTYWPHWSFLVKLWNFKLKETSFPLLIYQKIILLWIKLRTENLGFSKKACMYAEFRLIRILVTKAIRIYNYQYTCEAHSRIPDSTSCYNHGLSKDTAGLAASYKPISVGQFSEYGEILT